METEVSAYPLCWPASWPRTPDSRRKRAAFGKHGNITDTYRGKRDLTVHDGVDRVLNELRQLGVPRKNVIISTNIRVRLDNLPYSNAAEPADPGVAVYWYDPKNIKQQKCMAIDRYDRVADNLGAIAATLEAMRAIERHGGGSILDRAFSGFTALPAPISMQPWWMTLGFEKEVPLQEAERRYRHLAAKLHPDNGGDRDEWDRLQSAIMTARNAFAA